MGKACRHLNHEVEPQRHIWRGGQYLRTVAAQVYCADCKQWLFQKPINPDAFPRNAAERREARIDDSQASRRPARQADVAGP